MNDDDFEKLRNKLKKEAYRKIQDLTAIMALQPSSYELVKRFKQAITDQNKEAGDGFYRVEEEPHLVTFYAKNEPFFCLYETAPNEWHAKEPNKPAPKGRNLKASLEGFASFVNDAENNATVVHKIVTLSKTEQLFHDSDGNPLDVRVTQVNDKLVQLHYHEHGEAHLIMTIRKMSPSYWKFYCE